LRDAGNESIKLIEIRDSNGRRRRRRRGDPLALLVLISLLFCGTGIAQVGPEDLLFTMRIRFGSGWKAARRHENWSTTTTTTTTTSIATTRRMLPVTT
jgi:hypothetical protein